MDEREILRKWRDVFSGNEVSPETLAQAEALLEGLSGESPLQFRLASELKELKTGPTVGKKKRASRRQAT
jgi:hypothetical protein